MFSKKQTSKKQGDIGLGVAIAYFAWRGWGVSIPLTDSQAYDLVVDDGTRLCRVQVKTTSQRSRTGYHKVSLKTCGGTRGAVVVGFDAKAVDYLFVVTSSNRKYLIPADQVTAKKELALGTVAQFEVV